MGFAYQHGGAGSPSSVLAFLRWCPYAVPPHGGQCGAGFGSIGQLVFLHQDHPHLWSCFQKEIPGPLPSRGVDTFDPESLVCLGPRGGGHSLAVALSGRPGPPALWLRFLCFLSGRVEMLFCLGRLLGEVLFFFLLLLFLSSGFRVVEPMGPFALVALRRVKIRLGVVVCLQLGLWEPVAVLRGIAGADPRRPWRLGAPLRSRGCCVRAASARERPCAGCARLGKPHRSSTGCVPHGSRSPTSLA